MHEYFEKPVFIYLQNLDVFKGVQIIDEIKSFFYQFLSIFIPKIEKHNFKLKKRNTKTFNQFFFYEQTNILVHKSNIILES